MEKETLTFRRSGCLEKNCTFALNCSELSVLRNSVPLRVRSSEKGRRRETLTFHALLGWRNFVIFKEMLVPSRWLWFTHSWHFTHLLTSDDKKYDCTVDRSQVFLKECVQKMNLQKIFIEFREFLNFSRENRILVKFLLSEWLWEILRNESCWTNIMIISY